MEEATREKLPSLSTILNYPQSTSLTNLRGVCLPQFMTPNTPQSNNDDWISQPLSHDPIMNSEISSHPICVPYFVNIPQIFTLQNNNNQTTDNNNNNNNSSSNNANINNDSNSNNNNDNNNNNNNIVTSFNRSDAVTRSNNLQVTLPICKTTSSCKTKIKIGSGKISLIRKTVFTSVIQKFPCHHKTRPPCTSCVSNQGRSITSVCTQYYEVNYPSGNQSLSGTPPPLKSI